MFLLPEAKVSVPHIVSSTWLSRRHAGNFTIIGNTGNIFFLHKLLFNSTTQLKIAYTPSLSVESIPRSAQAMFS